MLKTENSWVGISLSKDDGKSYTANKVFYDASHLIEDRTFADKRNPHKKLKLFEYKQIGYSKTYYSWQITGSALEADTAYLNNGEERECHFVNYGWNKDKPLYYDTEGNLYEGRQQIENNIPEISVVKYESRLEYLNRDGYKSTVEVHNPYSYSQAYLTVNIFRYHGANIGDGGKELVIQRIDSIVGIYIASEY